MTVSPFYPVLLGRVCQVTTSGKSHWFWSDSSVNDEVAFLLFTITVTKIEVTRVQEIDPVDPWTIVGVIGGFLRKSHPTIGI